MLQIAQIATVGSPCRSCGLEFARLAPSGLCVSCDSIAKAKAAREAYEANRRAEIDELMGRLDSYIETELRGCGMATQELRASIDRIPRDIKMAIPREHASALMAGAVPESGLGLLGTTGTGKSMALAALIKAQVRASLTATVPQEGPVAVNWVRWESVPLLVDWLRDHARSEPELVAARIHDACTAKILVLDDLGAERRIGGYGSDYALGKLDLIVDTRWRECLPTWYTANVDGEAGLLSAYPGGARMISRLVGANPASVVSGQDLRLSRPVSG